MTEISTPSYITVNEAGPDLRTVRVAFAEDGHSSIEVYGPRTAFGEHEPAMVNWGGIGSRSSDDAARYAEGLDVAAAIAAEWNGEVR